LREHFRTLCAANGVVFDRYYKTEDDDVSDDAMPAPERDVARQLSLAL
jgi:hypothetical protein